MPARDAHAYLRIFDPARCRCPPTSLELHHEGLRERAAREGSAFDRELAIQRRVPAVRAARNAAAGPMALHVQRRGRFLTTR